jgi:predicted MFS family arabinose efflux permease
MVAVTLAGCLLQTMTTWNSAIPAYVLFLTIAGACRGISAWSLAQQFEEKTWSTANPNYCEHELISQASDRWVSTRAEPIWRIIMFFVIVQFSVYISASFFTPFKLGVLQLTYSQFSSLIIVSYLGKIVTLDFAGRIAKRIGGDKLLLIGSLGIIPVAGMWAISQQFWYLILVQLISGVAWSIYELATAIVLIERVPAAKRLKTISYFNVGNSLAMLSGAMLGASAFQILGSDFQAYLCIFIMSTAGRFTAIAFFPFNVLDWARKLRWLPVRRIAVEGFAVQSLTENAQFSDGEAEPGLAIPAVNPSYSSDLLPGKHVAA